MIKDKLINFCSKAKEAYPNIDEEHILVYFDDTVFGGGDRGVALTLDSVVITAEHNTYIPYKHILSTKVTIGMNIKITISLKNGNSLSFTLTQSNKGAILFAEILHLVTTERQSVKTERQSVKNRNIGIFLWLGILSMPYIFSFLTLREGYSMRARIIAFIPLAFCCMPIFFLSILGSPSTQAIQTTNRAQTHNTSPSEITNSETTSTNNIPVDISSTTETNNAKTESNDEVKITPTIPSLPFIGKRFFNFAGGSGTEYTIIIHPNGGTKVELHGTSDSSTEFEGIFSNPLPLANRFNSLLIKDDRIYLLENNKILIDCKGDGSVCSSALYESTE